MAQVLSRERCQHKPLEEDAEAKGLAQGPVASEKFGSRAYTLFTVPRGVNPVENLSLTRAGVVSSFPVSVTPRSRLQCSHRRLWRDCQGPHEAGQWPYRGYHTPELPLEWRNLILHRKQNRIPAPALPGALRWALGKPLNLSEPVS